MTISFIDHLIRAALDGRPGPIHALRDLIAQTTVSAARTATAATSHDAWNEAARLSVEQPTVVPPSQDRGIDIGL